MPDPIQELPRLINEQLKMLRSKAVGYRNGFVEILGDNDSPERL